VRPRQYLPVLSFLIWCWFALGGLYERFSFPAQTNYYRWLPIGLTLISVLLILLTRSAKLSFFWNFIAGLMVLALLPYLIFGSGGV
jgi:hypothetical protein